MQYITGLDTAYASMNNHIMEQLPVVARNLAFLMGGRKLSQGALARLTGVTQPTIWRILRGKSEMPETKTLAPLANFFGVTIEDLLKKDLTTGELAAASEQMGSSRTARDSDINVEPGPDIIAYYPVLGSVPAGDFREAIEAARSDPDTLWLPYYKKLARAFFLRIVGSSMYPTLVEGELVLVDLDAIPIHRSIVVVRNGYNETTVKRLMIDGNEKMLVPDNTQYPAKPVGTSVVVGVVRAAIKQFV